MNSIKTSGWQTFSAKGHIVNTSGFGSPVTLSHLLNSALLCEGNQKRVSKWATQNKTFFMNTKMKISYNFHALQSTALLLIVFFNYLQMEKPFLACRQSRRTSQGTVPTWIRNPESGGSTGEAPSGSLFASGLFWDRIPLSPKPGAFRGGLLMIQARMGEGDATILVS